MHKIVKNWQIEHVFISLSVNLSYLCKGSCSISKPIQCITSFNKSLLIMNIVVPLMWFSFSAALTKFGFDTALHAIFINTLFSYNEVVLHIFKKENYK